MATWTDHPTKQQDDFLTILGNSFKLIGLSWKAFVLNLKPLLLTIILPAILATALVVGLLAAMPYLFEGAPASTAEAVAIVGLLLLAVGLFSFFSVAITLIQLRGAKGETISAGEVWRTAPDYLLRMIGLLVSFSFTVIFGFIALIIPGLLALFFLSLSTYVLIDGNTTISDALKQSYEITKRNWKVVLALFVVNLVISLPSQNIEGVIWPVLGIISFALSLAYFFLPAIIYRRVAKVSGGKNKKHSV